jgi:hypothetical protein
MSWKRVNVCGWSNKVFILKMMMERLIIVWPGGWDNIIQYHIIYKAETSIALREVHEKGEIGEKWFVKHTLRIVNPCSYWHDIE